MHQKQADKYKRSIVNKSVSLIKTKHIKVISADRLNGQNCQMNSSVVMKN